jgi:hypothetical protein
MSEGEAVVAAKAHPTPGTRFPDFWAALMAPIPREHVRWRSDGGREVAYITARVVQNRLDDVVGPERWSAEFEKWSDGALLCRLTVALPDGTRVTRSDLGSYTRNSDRSGGKTEPGDDDKAGCSDGLKRAAVQFGIGRELYGDGLPEFVYERLGMTREAVAADDPGRREPGPARQPEPAPRPTAATRGGGRGPTPAQGGGAGPPRTGRALFASLKKREDGGAKGWIDWVNAFGKERGWDGKMVLWNEGQVAEVLEAMKDAEGTAA